MINASIAQKQSGRERGSALVYILVAIALLAGLTMVFTDSSNQNLNAQKSMNLAIELKGQIDFIRSSIQECVLSYPNGDPAHPGNNPPFPINPQDGYLASPAAGSWIQEVRCPGNPGNSNNHAKIFGPQTGKFAPKVPNGFNQWWYTSSADGVFIDLSTPSNEAYIKTALTRLDDMFEECEADSINAKSGTQIISTDGEWCAGGDHCFRVWLTIKPTAMYDNGDEDGDEAACPHT